MPDLKLYKDLLKLSDLPTLKPHAVESFLDPMATSWAKMEFAYTVLYDAV